MHYLFTTFIIHAISSKIRYNTLVIKTPNLLTYVCWYAFCLFWAKSWNFPSIFRRQYIEVTIYIEFDEPRESLYVDQTSQTLVHFRIIRKCMMPILYDSNDTSAVVCDFIQFCKTHACVEHGLHKPAAYWYSTSVTQTNMHFPDYQFLLENES